MESDALNARESGLRQWGGETWSERVDGAFSRGDSKSAVISRAAGAKPADAVTIVVAELGEARSL